MATPDIDQPWLPRLADLAQELEPGCEVYDLYPIGENKESHNFMEPANCHCFPEMLAYASLEGKPDMVIITHRWNQ
jgi:hypothetical protein